MYKRSVPAFLLIISLLFTSISASALTPPEGSNQRDAASLQGLQEEGWAIPILAELSEPENSDKAALGIGSDEIASEELEEYSMEEPGEIEKVGGLDEEKLEEGQAADQQQNEEEQQLDQTLDGQSEEEAADQNEGHSTNTIDLSAYTFDEIVEGDVVISKTTTISGKRILYTGNLTIMANVTVKSPVVVLGTVNIGSGYLSITSDLAVGGDFRIQAQDGDGNYIETSGYLRLAAGSKLSVYGDFYVQTISTLSIGSGTSSNPSILELHGDFRQVGTNTIFRQALGNLKTVFSGDGEQHVSFDRIDSNAEFCWIEVSNERQAIYLDTPIYSLRPLNSFAIVGDLEVARMDGNDCVLDIFGSFIPKGSLSINNSLNITGDATIDSDVSIYRDMYVGGDVRVQRPDGNGNYGETKAKFFISRGVKVTVLGDFYAQSTNSHFIGGFYSYGLTDDVSVLELHGNFTQIGSATRFTPYFNYLHKTIFAGDGEQHVSFDRVSSSVSLGMIEVTNARQAIYLDTPMYDFHPLNSFTICSDLETTLFNGSDVTLDIEGSFRINPSLGNTNVDNFLNIAGCAIIYTRTILNRDMKVGGDLRIQRPNGDGTFGQTEGFLRVRSGVRLSVLGDFYTQSNNITNFGGGTAENPAILELQGDLFQIGAKNDFTSAASSLRIVLSGSGDQCISFENTSQSNLGLLSKTNAGNVRFLTEIKSFTAESDLSIVASEGSSIGTLKANGKTVHFASSANLGSVDLAGGALVCDGDLTLSGVLNVNGGMVNAKKDVIIDGISTIKMSNPSDIFTVKRDLIIIKTSFYNINLESGFFDLKGNLTIYYNTSFTTGEGLYAQFSSDQTQYITLHKNNKVNFAVLAVPNMNPRHCVVTKGNISYYLDGLRLNEPCKTSSCGFDLCGSHEFPDISCGKCLKCSSACVKNLCTSCNSSCVTCKLCSTCQNSIIFTKIVGTVYDITPEIDQIKARYFGTSGIHTPTGNFSHSFTDMTVPTVLGDLTLSRTYNSLKGTSKNSLPHQRGHLHWSFYPKMLANTSGISCAFWAKAPANLRYAGTTSSFLTCPLQQFTSGYIGLQASR